MLFNEGKMVTWRARTRATDRFGPESSLGPKLVVWLGLNASAWICTIYVIQAARGAAGGGTSWGLFLAHALGGYFLLMLYLSERARFPCSEKLVRPLLLGVCGMLFVSVIVLPKPLFRLTVRNALGDLDSLATQIEHGKDLGGVRAGGLDLVDVSRGYPAYDPDDSRHSQVSETKVEIVRLQLPDGSLLWRPTPGADYGDPPFEGWWHWKATPNGP